MIAVLFNDLPITYARTNNQPLSIITQSKIQSVHTSGIPISGLRILAIAPVAISITAKIRSIDTASHAMGSIFPCP